MDGFPARSAAADDPAARALLAAFARETEQRYGQVFEGVATPHETIESDGLVPPHGCLLVIGHARRLLGALEDAARVLGYVRIRLDTGPLQPEAAALCASAGYHAIAPYADMPPHSLFFEKALPPAGEGSSAG